MAQTSGRSGETLKHWIGKTSADLMVGDVLPSFFLFID